MNSNKVTIGIQTSSKHFKRVENTKEFKQMQHEKKESIDWAQSSLFHDICFEKKKRKGNQNDSGTQHEDGGNQVSFEEILLVSDKQILSQIECEYNTDQLKRKIVRMDDLEDNRLLELYTLGINTLEATMNVLRLHQEWELVTKPQYAKHIFDPEASESTKITFEHTHEEGKPLNHVMGRMSHLFA